MFVKWIVCDVPKPKREAFDRAQRAWSVLGASVGLVAQVGGWDQRAGEPRACILTIWRDPAVYDAFFRHVHDAVTYRNRQAETCEKILTATGPAVVRMRGQERALVDAASKAELLRVADCRVREGRADHFVDVQLRVWEPGMATVDGMLGGLFSSLGGERYLVTTLWRDEESHERYVRDHLEDLRAQATVDVDLASREGHRVVLEPAWRVLPNAGLAG